MLSPQHIETMFMHSDGYRFARWARPIVPVVFGVEDETLGIMKTAIATTVGITGRKIEELDPEIGANFMWFFCKDWEEILDIPKLEKLIPNLKEIISTLQSNNINTHRVFSFEATGGIKLCVVLICLKGEVATISIDALTMRETFLALTLWSSSYFLKINPIAVIATNTLCVVKPKYAVVLRAIYNPILPNATTDKTHALRVFARAFKLWKEMENE